MNSTHTLNVAAAVQTLSGGIENSTVIANFGRWNDNGAQSHTITVLPGDGGTGFPATSPQVATYSANFIELLPYTSTVYPASKGTVAISPSPKTYTGATGEFFVARQQATLTATPATPSVCTVSGTTVSLLEAGTCTIQASQAGNIDYAAAKPVDQSFSVTLASQTITFPAIGSQVVGTKLTLKATASSVNHVPGPYRRRTHD